MPRSVNHAKKRVFTAAKTIQNKEAGNKAMHLFLIANSVTTSKALVTNSVALVTNSFLGGRCLLPASQCKRVASYI